MSNERTALLELSASLKELLENSLELVRLSANADPEIRVAVSQQVERIAYVSFAATRVAIEQEALVTILTKRLHEVREALQNLQKQADAEGMSNESD